MESVGVSYVNLGDQKLCQITGIQNKEQTMDPVIFYILDISGSMGCRAQYAQESFKRIIVENNIPNVVVATFGKYSNIKAYKGNEIRKWLKFELEGDTRLFDTIKNVFKYISEIKEKRLFQIVIVSDGAVFDLSDVLKYVSEINPEKLNQHIIQVSAIRIGTSGDTRALSCFSVFHNHPTCEPQIIDVSGNCTQNELENALITIFGNFAEGRACYSGQIISNSNDLCRFPFDPLLVNTLDVNNNDYFICSSADPIITFEGRPLLLVQRKTFCESDIVQYMKIIEQKVRTIKVLGDNKFLKNIVPFLNNLTKSLKEDSPDVSNLSKMARIHRDILKSQGTIINRILQLINIDGVHKFNSQQQAQFLRQIDETTQSGRRLAKRANENPNDVLSILINGIRRILNGYQETNLDTDVRSFLSLSSSTDILNEALLEMKDDLDMFNLEDLLQCFGQVGICFRAHIGNYPDPWQFKVEEVYTCFLGQHDIYIASNADRPLKVPESNKIITGVDVISYDNVKNYVLERSVNKLHCSIAMRKTVADIPNDDIALKTAVIFQMIDQVMEQPLEKSIYDLCYNINTLRDIIGNNSNNIFGEEIIGALLLPNMDAYFTGDLNVSSINKIIALLLVNRSKVNLQKLARSLLSLDCYHHIRLIDCPREAIITKAFQINMDNRTLAKEPFEKEPDNIEHYDKYDEGNVVLVSQSYWNRYNKIINFIKFMHVFSVSEDPNTLLANIRNQHMNICQIFGISSEISLELFITANIIQALESHKLECRVNVSERRMLLAPLLTLENISAYFKSIVSNIFRVDYEKQLALKHNNEVERENIVQIEQLIWSCEIDEFVNKLNEFIPQRDCNKYMLLIDALSREVMIPLFQDKIWVIVLCKVPGSDDIIWNRGNMCSKRDFELFKEIWNNNDLSSLDWKELDHKWFVAPRIHQYRESDIPNRHGHCNSNPYLGLG